MILITGASGHVGRTVVCHTPLVMHHASWLSIIGGRGDVVTRFILLLSADAYAPHFVNRA
jgi:hypothetical protein